MIPLLPKWNLHTNRATFYDTDSVTMLELAGRLHGAMNELITDYNQFAESINNQFTEFMNCHEGDLETFKVSIRQEFQDFIDAVDIKLAKYGVDHKEIIEIADELKAQLDNVDKVVTDKVNELNENSPINKRVDDLEKRLVVYDGARTVTWDGEATEVQATGTAGTKEPPTFYKVADLTPFDDIDNVSANCVYTLSDGTTGTCIPLSDNVQGKQVYIITTEMAFIPNGFMPNVNYTLTFNEPGVYCSNVDGVYPTEISWGKINDTYISNLIDEKLGVIENGAY